MHMSHTHIYIYLYSFISKHHTNIELHFVSTVVQWFLVWLNWWMSRHAVTHIHPYSLNFVRFSHFTPCKSFKTKSTVIHWTKCTFVVAVFFSHLFQLLLFFSFHFSPLFFSLSFSVSQVFSFCIKKIETYTIMILWFSTGIQHRLRYFFNFYYYYYYFYCCCCYITIILFSSFFLECVIQNGF